MELSRATLGEVLPRHPLLAGATGRAQGLPLGAASVWDPLTGPWCGKSHGPCSVSHHVSLQGEPPGSRPWWLPESSK